MLTKSFDVYNVFAESPLAVTSTGAVVTISGDGTPGANLQIPWFIDPVNGDDNNTGLTALVPVKTEQEVISRIGTQIIPVEMIWNLMNDFPASNPFYIPSSLQIGSGGSLSLVSAKPLTQLFAGTLSGAAAITRGAGGGSRQTVTDVALPVSWAAVGALNTQSGALVRIRLTANNAQAFGTVETVAKTMATTPFTIPATTPGGLPVTYVPAGNEAYVIETGYLNIADFRVYPSGNGLPVGVADSRIFGFGLALSNTGNPQLGFLSANTPVGLNNVFFSNCDLGRIQPVASTTIGANACKLSGSSFSVEQGFLSAGACLVTAALTLSSQSGGATTIGGGVVGSNFVSDTLFDLGGRLIVSSQGAILERVGFFSTTGGNTDSIVVNPGGMVRATNFINASAVYGSGIGRAGINCNGSGRFVYTAANKPTVTGVVTDARLDGVNLSYAKLPFIDVLNDFFRTGLVGVSAGAATRFLASDYTESATDVTGYLVEEPCIVRNLRIRAGTAPGGAVTDVYTVFLNGVATTVTASLGPAATTGSDTTNSFTAAVGDRLSVQVTGAGSATANVLVAVEVLSTLNQASGIIAN